MPGFNFFNCIVHSIALTTTQLNYGYHSLTMLDNITSIERTFGVTYIFCKIDNILGKPYAPAFFSH